MIERSTAREFGRGGVDLDLPGVRRVQASSLDAAQSNRSYFSLVAASRPGPRSLEVFLGDYVDRGANSKLLIECCAVGNDLLVLTISTAFAAPLLDVLSEPSGGGK
jgi:hypothetical protein